MGTQLPPQKGGHSSLPKFSVHVCCGQMAGSIKMPLGTEVGLSAGHIVLDGDPVPLKLQCGPMPSVMAALPNIGGALCSMPQSLADAHYQWRAVTLSRCETPLKLAGVPQTRQRISAVSGPKFTMLWGHVEQILLFNKFFSDCRYMP